MMRRFSSVVELVALKIIQRQSMALVVVVVAIVYIRHLHQLRLSIIVVPIVVIVRVVLDDHLSGRARLSIGRNHREHGNLARRVWLILLVLVRN